MASYTMTLGSYIEAQSQYEDNLSMNARIEQGRSKLFDFDYPIFAQEYKKTFETNIIRKFYMREIGFETEGLFKFYLETFLNINMPYFNMLFESELLEFDPLVNSDINVTHTQNKQKSGVVDKDSSQNVVASDKQLGGTQNDTTTSATHNSTGTNVQSGERINDDFNRKVNSDTPDSRLQLQTEEGKGIIEYASKIDELKTNDKETTSTNKETAEENIGSSSGQDVGTFEKETNALSDIVGKDKTTSNIGEIVDFIENRKGKIGAISYADMMLKYRQTFLRIENMIHNEMQDLFMLVY